MRNTYIKFEALEKRVRKIPPGIGADIEKVIPTTITPITNPDFETKIKDVSTWLVEFEGDSYYPNREVGLDISDMPIIIMPWQKNYGYWTDNDLTIEDFRSDFNSIDISKEEFERYWKLFDRNNRTCLNT